MVWTALHKAVRVLPDDVCVERKTVPARAFQRGKTCNLLRRELHSVPHLVLDRGSLSERDVAQSEKAKPAELLLSRSRLAPIA